nr:hypothetical protein [Tanacetum cinerariifolium]
MKHVEINNERLSHKSEIKTPNQAVYGERSGDSSFSELAKTIRNIDFLFLKKMLTDGIKQSESYQMYIKCSTGQIPPKKSRCKDVALELGKSISLTKAAEEEATRKAHASHARIMTEPVPEPARRRPLGIAFRDTSSVSKKISSDPSQKLKGVQTLTPEEQIVADTMKALKERVPDDSTVIPATSSKGTDTKPGVADKEKVTSEDNVILEWGYEQESEYTKEEDDDETIEWVDTDKEEKKKDDDDEKSIDLEHTDDEETDDEFVHVNDDEDEEMTNAEVEEFRNDDEEITDAAKVDAGKTEEPSVLTPIPKTPLVALAITLLPHPSVSTIPPILLQTKTPILSPPITTEAPTVTTNVLKSDPFTAVQLRVEKLKKDVSELKKIDHSIEALASLKS